MTDKESPLQHFQRIKSYISAIFDPNIAFQRAKILSDFIGIIVRAGFLRGIIEYIKYRHRDNDELAPFLEISKWPIWGFYLFMLFNIGLIIWSFVNIGGRNASLRGIYWVDDLTGRLIMTLVLLGPIIMFLEEMSKLAVPLIK